MPRAAIARKGWQVTNAAGIHAIPVAETGIALLSGVARRVDWTTRNRIKGEWVRPPGIFELFEKTAGVIAMGGIGRAFAERARALGMRVIGVDVNPAAKPDYVDELRGVDGLGWLLESSDVVCMTAPDTPKSHHMMNAERFAQMKQGSIFLNVSRGGLVDTDALVDAIDSGRFFGVGLDVIEGEPLRSDHPIWSRQDVLITPHVGGTSPRRLGRMIELFTENLRRYQAGEPLRKPRRSQSRVLSPGCPGQAYEHVGAGGAPGMDAPWGRGSAAACRNLRFEMTAGKAFSTRASSLMARPSSRITRRACSAPVAGRKVMSLDFLSMGAPCGSGSL